MLVESNLHLNWVLSPISPHHKCAAQPLLTETLCERVTWMQRIDPVGSSNRQDWMNWSGKVSTFMINSLICSTSHMVKKTKTFSILSRFDGEFEEYLDVLECVLGMRAQIRFPWDSKAPHLLIHCSELILIWRSKAQNTLMRLQLGLHKQICYYQIHEEGKRTQLRCNVPKCIPSNQVFEKGQICIATRRVILII